MKVDASNAIKAASLTMLNALVDTVFEFLDQPLLPSQKNFAPVEEIGEIVQVLCTEGKFPVDFPEGVYIRNGANPLFGGLKSTVSILGTSNDVWIEGEGMLHAVYFTRNARGDWRFAYTNRYVETDTFKMEKLRGRPTFLPTVEGDPPAILAAHFLNLIRFGIPNKIMSNTNVFEHGGKHYSVTENYLPQEIDLMSLETLSNWDLNGAWGRPFTSHPKKVPGTGELVTMGFYPEKPYCVVGVISADGKELTHKLDIQMDRCTMFHDVGVTEKYNILIDHLLTVDVARIAKGGQLFKYEKEKEARIGVIPRYGNAGSIKWFQIKPCCVFHILDSYEDGSEVIVRGCKANAAIIPGPDWGEDKFDWFSRGFKPIHHSSEGNGKNSMEEGMLFSCIREWRLNMETGEVKESDLSGTELSMDFPMINEDFTGLKHKYGYAQVIDSAASSTCGKTKYGGLAKLYLEEQTSTPVVGSQGGAKIKMEYHMFPKNNYCTGSAFVAKPGGIEEDDGWVVTFVHDEDSDLSHVLVVHAKKFEDDPIAKISLPQRVPYGHHGAFFRIPKRE